MIWPFDNDIAGVNPPRRPTKIIGQKALPRQRFLTDVG
jgi:hypothetical protein